MKASSLNRSPGRAGRLKLYRPPDLHRVIAGGICLDTRLFVQQLAIGSKHIVTAAPVTTIGGGAANDSIAQKALAPDRRIELFAHLGKDQTGARIWHEMVDAKDVELPLAPLDELATSESLIVSETDFEARGTIFTIPGARGPDLPLEPIIDALQDAEAFCLCAPSNNHQIAPLLEAARAARVPAYFTLGSAQIYRMTYDELQHTLDASIELLTCNQQEASRVTGTEDIQQQLTALRFGGRVRTSVVTCGAEGLWGFDNTGVRHAPAYRDSRPVVDDTGAGDAAAAAIIDALVRGRGLDDALAAGARNGFEACAGYGLEHVCHEAQMTAYLETRRRKAA